MRQAGEIRLRSLLELALLALVAYVAFQIGPAILLRTRFFNEMEVAANSPVHMTADDIRRKLLLTAEAMDVVLLYQNLHVVRDTGRRQTVITARYDIYLKPLPGWTYVWHVRDQAVAHLY